MKQHLKTIVVFLLIVAVCGGLAVVSGVLPIRASDGHWAITRWFLNFSKERSVAFHSGGIKVPDLDRQDLVVKGAGHYEIGCLQCHGSPKREAPRVVAYMTPKPPDIASLVKEREPEELFYIVKHGILMTGMPAWPSLQRDDEVWSVVAFLLKYPELDHAAYRQLALGELDLNEAPDTIEGADGGSLDVPHHIVESCAMCHGLEGRGRGHGVFPVLAGQNEAYLVETLIAYRDDKRHSGTMEAVLGRLDVDDLRRLAEYYANLPATAALPVSGTDDSPTDQERTEAIERGRQIAMEGLPEQKVPSCADCHPIDGSTINDEYPVLNGQYADYLELQLELFAEGVRGGTDAANLMQPVVDHLEPEQMRDVALFYAAQPREESP